MGSGKLYPFKNPVIRWVDERLPVFTLMHQEYAAFPTPKNFNYLYNFGAIAMVMLVIMIATGITLAMSYDPTAAGAFNSVERIMRDVNGGWMLRYLHMNGAHFFFLAVYIHMFRGLYYGSYKQPRELLWMLGVTIFLIMMATAFLGYSLPWSQMSGWGATVITSLFSAIPIVGDSIVTWLWGGFSVDNPTLNRFFALHFTLPFVIFAVVFLHIWALHITGSNNPTGIEIQDKKQDSIPFHPYYTIKDSFGLLVFLAVYAMVSFFAPNILGHADHYIPFDPMVTPAHIVPEWYFLPFYAILRSLDFNIGIPFTDIVLMDSKLLGVIAMFASIGILYVLPFLDKHPVRSAVYRPRYKFVLWCMVISFIALGYIGAMPAEGIWPILGKFFTAVYFAYFVAVWFLNKHEKPLPMPKSIHDAVMQKKKAKKAKATAKSKKKAKA